MSSNIFEIWDSLDRKTPFAVRRDNWSVEYYTIVENVECEKMPYGKAFGFPTKNGQYSTHYEYDKKWRKERLIPCCGCYQWSLVNNADLENYKNGVKASENEVKGANSLNSRLYFGKYKDQTIDEVFNLNPNYIEWLIVNIDNFLLTSDTFEYLNSLNPNFKFSDNVKMINDSKLLKK